ncbi:hypothetical protein [Parasynechococcus sp.]|uniref:hypothetical protein n=1 Tax=Parasynechococcus sp. TaxID=3101203 RepID=UPI003704877B
MYKWTAERDPRSANLKNIEETVMERRIVVATGWASTRIAVLDKEERYEDSYAITQEFCEWITCIGENVEMLEANVLAVPRNPSKRRPIHDPRSNDSQVEI